MKNLIKNKYKQNNSPFPNLTLFEILLYRLYFKKILNSLVIYRQKHKLANF